MSTRNRTPVLIVAAIVGISLGSCGDPGPDEGNAQVRVVVQGAGTADNVVDVLLWAEDTGTSYDFNILGEAGSSDANFILDISRDSTVVHTVEFSLPIGLVSASEGDTGSGTATAPIYPDTLNTVTIAFNWDNDFDPQSETLVSLEFFHPPNIYEWSAAPGPGVVAGTEISVQADVEFFGTDGEFDPTVTAQFLDSGGAGLGTGVSLTYSSPIWSGKLYTELGAVELMLTATDEEGTTESTMGFAVTTP